MKNKFFKDITILSLLILFLMGCTSKGEIEDTSVRIDLRNPNFLDESTIPQYINPIRFLKLETSPECLIGNIDKIKIIDDRIYILDRVGSRSLFVFTSTGSFLHKIGNIGQGVGEFLRPSDFNVDKTTGLIYVMDFTRGKIICYSKEGEFVSDINISIRSNNFLIQDSLVYLDRSNSYFKGGNSDFNYNLFICDNTGSKIINSYLPYQKHLKNKTFAPFEPLQELNGNISYLPVFDNCIYSFNNTKMFTHYNIDFGNYWPDKDFIKKYNDREMIPFLKKMNEANKIMFLNYLETNDYLYLTYFQKDNNKHIFYSKLKNELLCFENKKKSQSTSILGRICTYKDDQFVGIINPQDFLQKNYQQFEIPYSSNTKTDDNPILFFFSMK